jgi:hypothetical protein
MDWRLSRIEVFFEEITRQFCSSENGQTRTGGGLLRHTRLLGKLQWCAAVLIDAHRRIRV